MIYVHTNFVCCDFFCTCRKMGTSYLADTHLKRHLGFVVWWQIPGEEDRCFHDSFDSKV